MDRLALLATITASALALVLLARAALPRTGRRVAGRRPGGRATSGPAGGAGDGWRLEGDGAMLRLRLDLELAPGAGGVAPDTGDRVARDGDPAAALVRLARAAALDALSTAPAAVTRVEVIDRVGRTVTTIERGAAAHLPADSTRAAPAARPHVPAPVRAVPGPGGPATALPHAGSTGRRALADRLSLPANVRADVRQPDSPADVVRALLRAAGRSVDARGDLLISDGVAIAFADVRGDAEHALSRAYLRIESSGTEQGLVIVLGFADPALVRRRDLATPTVRYVDAGALERMADAVAVGLDPMAFAAPPRARA